ncbi:MAG: hypothetical protein WEE53_11585 [Acidimicrobiia bacterium]
MGRAVALLVQNELPSVVHEADGGLVVLAELESKVTERQLALDAKERDLEEWEQALNALTRVALVARQPSA